MLVSTANERRLKLRPRIRRGRVSSDSACGYNSCGRRRQPGGGLRRAVPRSSIKSIIFQRLCVGFGWAIVVESGRLFDMEDGQWEMADGGGQGIPLTLILCDRSTARSCLEDSAPPKGRGDGKGAGRQSGDLSPRSRGEGAGKKVKIAKRTQFCAGRRGKVGKTKPKTNPFWGWWEGRFGTIFG